MVTSSVSPTVQGFLTILVGRLTRYDKMLEAKGQANLYRLGHWFEAKEKVEAMVRSQLQDSTPEALNALKQALNRHFLVKDMPPARAVVKMIDDFLASGKLPKYATADRVIDRFLGINIGA